MKKFQEMLMKDLGWKLLSIAIAIIMWFMVININQPVDTRTYSKYITLENMDVLTDRGLTVRNADELISTKVNIKIKAQRTALDRLNQSNDWLQVSIDLGGLGSAMDGDKVSLPVDVVMVGGYTGYNIVSKVPTTVDVYIERVASKELPIEVVISGELPKDAIYASPLLSTETVKVTGPASAVEQVAAVRAGINAQDVVGSVQLGAKLVAYDANGTAVKGVKLSVSDITVTYNSLNAKTIPIKVNISGTPAEGYVLGDTVSTPQTLEVIGAPELLSELIYLQLPDIDISGSSGNVRKSFAVQDYLPEGVTPKDTNNLTIQVNVQVMGVNNRELTVHSDQLVVTGGDSGKSYAISGSVKVTITGDGGILDGINESTLAGTVDVSGLSVGHHKVPIQLELPEGATAGYAFIDVIISEDTTVPDNES
ncbi:CdaR family protein [Anaerotignum sp.]|uniref:CdaR family protein n=1 Tax=Anaerotignum sp. TaxID=2039241 RepID=UPI0028A9F42B|nr:CdaR family protein [Anaerotignum sp.]